MVQVNAIGDACPIPVIKTLHALQDLNGAGTVQTLVDNEIAVQNLTRLAESKGCSITTEKRSDKEFCVTITTENSIGKAEADEQISCTVPAAQKKTVVVISADHMGEGDEELGRILIKGFIFALTQHPAAPQHLPTTAPQLPQLPLPQPRAPAMQPPPRARFPYSTIPMPTPTFPACVPLWTLSSPLPV